jgi:hypothetical protein
MTFGEVIFDNVKVDIFLEHLYGLMGFSQSD